MTHPALPGLVLCPVCRGTGRNPEAPAAIAGDDGTCLVCCEPLPARYARHHGFVLAELGEVGSVFDAGGR